MALDDQQFNGFWVGAQLSRDWGVEVAFRRTSTDVIRPAGGVFPTEPKLATIDFGTLDATAQRVFRRGNFLPYLAAGIAGVNLDINLPDRSVRDTNRLGAVAAAGARFYAAPWVGVRVEARERATYLGRRRLGQDQGWADSGRWFRNTEVTGGLFFSFGGR